MGPRAVSENPHTNWAKTFAHLFCRLGWAVCNAAVNWLELWRFAPGGTPPNVAPSSHPPGGHRP
jgi:hypothetical protein